jgi:hypothetical protein
MSGNLGKRPQIEILFIAVAIDCAPQAMCPLYQLQLTFGAFSGSSHNERSKYLSLTSIPNQLKSVFVHIQDNNIVTWLLSA